jgi:hypothetical protein
MFALIPARADRSLEHFHEHWRTTHRELALQIEGMRRYVQCHRLPLSLAGLAEAPFEGIAVTWFDEVNAAMGLVDDPVFTEEIGPDELEFMDVEKRRLLFTVDDELLVEGPIPRELGAVKTTLLLRRPPAVEAPAFEEWWQGRHRDCVAEAFAGAQRAVSSLAIVGPNQPNVRIDGVVELWWPDTEELQANWPESWRRYSNCVDAHVDLDRSFRFASTDLWAIGP